MDLFRTAGDWFRGLFGNSEEEKKKKQQQAQQQAQQTVTKPQASKQSLTNAGDALAPKVKTASQLFTPKPTPKVTEAPRVAPIKMGTELKVNTVTPQPKTQTQQEINAIYQQKLPSYVQKEKQNLGWMEQNITDRGWEKRAQDNAMNAAIAEWQDKNNNYSDTTATKMSSEVSSRRQAASEESKANIEKTNQAVDIMRLLPGAGIGELGANFLRRVTGNLSENDMLREQLGLSQSQIDALSPDDRNKYLGVAAAGLAAGLLDFAGLGAGSLIKGGAKGAVKGEIKNLAKKEIAKIIAKDAGMGAAAGAGIGYGGSKLLGADDKQAGQNAVSGALSGLLGGLFGSPLDVASTAAKTDARTAKNVARNVASDVADNRKFTVEKIDTPAKTVAGYDDWGNPIDEKGLIIKENQLSPSTSYRADDGDGGSVRYSVSNNGKTIDITGWDNRSGGYSSSYSNTNERPEGYKPGLVRDFINNAYSNGAKEIRITTAQSVDTRAVLDNLVKEGALTPTGYTGISVDRHPNVFTINDAITKPKPSSTEAAIQKVVQDQNPDAVKVLNDPNATAAEKAAAQAKLDAATEAIRTGQYAEKLPEQTFNIAEYRDTVTKQEEANFNNYVKTNPGLTTDQIRVERQKMEARIEQLVSEAEQNQKAATTAVEGQKAAAETNQQNLQDTVGETKQAQQDATSPTDTGTGGTGAEQAANNGYNADEINKIAFGDSPAFQERNGLSIGQKLSPDRLIREYITRRLENAANTGIRAAQNSGVKGITGIGRLFTGFSREAGLSPEMQTARMQLRGGVETGKVMRQGISELSNGMDENALKRVWATLDPELAKQTGIKNPGKIKLTPEEATLRENLKTIIDGTTSENLKRGLITPQQAKNESYIKRSYTVYDGNTDAKDFEGGFRRELLNQYKGRKKVSDAMAQEAIQDPVYLVAKKTAESHAMWAMQDYGNYLTKSGMAVDTPKNGYIQLPETPTFGSAAGKFVPKTIAEDFTGFQYNSAMMNAINDAFTAYDRLGIRQAKKQILTIFNPAVRLGNQMTNRGIFSQLAGVNPVQFNYVYTKVGKMMSENHQLYREAVAQGLTGVDITQADFYAKQIAAAAGQDKNAAKKAIEYIQKSYSGADDKARITAYVIKRGQGYSPEEAARQVQRGFQDYKSVGFFYDIAAKTPVLGNAFVRFAADSIRILKNAAVDHPLRSAGTVMLWATLVNAMSVASGESELQGNNPAEQAFNLATGNSKSDAQKTRESRFGAPKLSFTDISLAVQTPFGELNVARFMPWYSLNDINDSGVGKFMPFQASPITFENGQAQVNPKAMNDPLLGQVAQLIMDKDFRNKSIQDPNNTGQYALDPITPEQKAANVARFLFTNNAPLGREADAIYSAATGQEDIYGKTRSVPQAAARALGFKVEQYGKDQVADQKAKEAYFADLDQINKELEGMTPTEQEVWKKMTGYYKLREQVDNQFQPGTTRDKKAPVYDFSEDKWKDYAAYPKLYDLMVQKKQQDNTRSGTPIQPIFDTRLSESFRKQLVQNKMVAPGDDAELDQRMYSSPEWDYYQTLNDRYKEDSKAYYGDSEYAPDEMVKHQNADFPEKPDAYKAYTVAYAAYANGQTTNKPEFTDAVKAAKEQYDKATFDWTNTERAARGLPAITWEMWQNPTFGYDSTPSGYGYGGSNYNAADHVDLISNLTNYSDSIKRIDPVKAQEIANIAAIFSKLKAKGGGGRTKPTLGASSKGLS